MDIGLCLFLADRPFRLGHLEISFGICSKTPKAPVGRLGLPGAFALWGKTGCALEEPSELLQNTLQLSAEDIHSYEGQAEKRSR